MKRFIPLAFLLLLLTSLIYADESQAKNYMISVRLKEGHDKVRIDFTAPDKHRIYTYRDLKNDIVTFYTSSIGFIPSDITVQQFDTGMDMIESIDRKEIVLDGKPSLEPLPADFKQILENDPAQWRYSDWEVYRWESFPGILIIDFQNYNIQSHMLKRLSYFVEKRGYTGKIHSFLRLSGKSDWNAHNYKAKDLAAFFTEAQRSNALLTSSESYLMELLLANGIIERGEAGYTGGEDKGIVSVSQESAPHVRSLLLTHEGYHGLFYAAPGLKELVYDLWDKLAPEAQEMWVEYLRTADAWNYDYRNGYLLRNEMLGYMMQQKDFAEYFDNMMFPRLLKRIPDKAEHFQGIRDAARQAFLDTALKIAVFLQNNYNLSPGNLSYMREVRP
ncbi:MAG: hypothetical protein IKO95_02170 [Spirochaetia bacterium]|nr:hypothetical protein [Spirochaetia bacterium]